MSEFIQNSMSTIQTKMRFISWKMPIVDKLYHSISKYDIYHETSLPLFANAWSMLRSFPSLFADLPSNVLPNILTLKIFFTCLYIYTCTNSPLRLSHSENWRMSLLLIFWHFLMKMGLKNDKMTRDTYLKQKLWNQLK